MKTVRKKISITVIMLFVFSAVFFGTLIAYSFGDSLQTTEAATLSVPVSDGYINIGDLLMQGYETREYKFNDQVLTKLYEQITGKSKATYDDVKKLAPASTANASTAIGQAGSVMFRSNNKALNGGNGKDILLTFGGMEWTAVGLSLDSSGQNVVLDLLMKDTTTEVYQFNKYKNSSKTTYGTYPSNMYGTSYMRAVVLNNGGTYATDVSTYNTTATQSSSSIFAKFTMSDVTGSVKQFIVAPKDTYQKKNTATTYVISNSFGVTDYTNGIIYWQKSINSTLEEPSYGFDSNFKANYVTNKESLYAGWGSDSVWIPGYAQLGRAGLVPTGGSTNQGRWGLSSYQYKTTKKYFSRYAYTYDEGSVGLRAFSTTGLSTAYTTADNKGYEPCDANSSLSVRAAIHLNLTKANDNAVQRIKEPEDMTETYSGNKWKIDSTDSTAYSIPQRPAWFDPTKIAITQPTMIDKGEYEVTATIKPEQPKLIFEGTAEEGESLTVRKFKFTIKPKPINPVLSMDGTPQRPKADLTGLIYSIDTGDAAPTIGFTYKKKTGGTTYDKWPSNDAGTFIISPVISNASTCKNYVIADSPNTLEVDIKCTVTFNSDTDVLVWYAAETGGTKNRITESKLTYSPKGYTVSVGDALDTGGTLAEKGVKVSVIKVDGTGSGATATVQNAKTSYALKVILVNADDYETFSEEVEYTLTVEQAKYDLSQVKWDYSETALHTYVKNFISYTDDEQSEVKSRYTSSYTLDTSDGALDLNDFEDLESALPAKDLEWKIVKRQLSVPAYTGENLVFSNTETDLLQLLGIPDDYAEYFTVSAKFNDQPVQSFMAKDAGKYTVTCLLRTDPDIRNNVSWAGGTMLVSPVNVTVEPRTVTISGWTDSSMPSPIVGDDSDLDFIDSAYTNTNGEAVTLDDIYAQYNTTFRVKAESKFGDNVIVRTEENVLDYAEFSTPADPNVPAERVPKPTLVQDTLAYTGAPVTFELRDFDDTIMIMVGSLTVTDAGDYDIVIRFRDGVNYCWNDGSRDPITLTMHLSNDPDAPAPVQPGEDGPGLLDKIKALLEKGFPLWQIITMAVGALLSLIFMIKAIQYGNRKKQAQGEAKKISSKAYGALLPVFATDVVALGLSNKIWSIMAFAVAGFTVLMLATMLITHKGWKKAELAKESAIEEREQRKITAEKEERRELQERISKVSSGSSDVNIEEILRRQREEMEDRHRQEMEAMKLMLANMMGRGQGMDNADMGYATMDNTDLLVQKVIAGLLPMVQQMIPEPTAYLSAPMDLQNDRYDTLTSVLQQQNDALQQQNAQIVNLQNQIADMSRNVLEAEIIPDHSDEIRAMADEHNAQIAEQNAQIAEQNAQIADLQSQIADLSQGRLEAEILPDQSEELRAMAEAHNAEMQAMSAEMNAKLAEMQSKMDMMSSMSVDELDDEDFDDEEEWDSILDEDDDDFVEAVIIDDNGNVRKTYPNFRMRLKQSSDKNREWYAVIKNMFCSQKGVTYRVYKRVEKIRYQGQVVGVIGIAKRSIKLWLALKPYEYDARRYHHKDVSDKPRFVDVPMYVRITSDRALLRAEELILALFQELNMEARKRYNDRSIQELIFTLKHNRLLTNKQYKSLLCETMHVHDCDVLDDETAEKCIENKHVDSIDDSYIATIKLDDIDANFQDGNRVTLERLKKVGLVPEDCTGFTVTAGQRLTKPLIIVANDFTLDAVKLITLTGGRAIRLTLV